MRALAPELLSECACVSVTHCEEAAARHGYRSLFAKPRPWAGRQQINQRCRCLSLQRAWNIQVAAGSRDPDSHDSKFTYDIYSEGLPSQSSPKIIQHVAKNNDYGARRAPFCFIPLLGIMFGTLVR